MSESKRIVFLDYLRVVACFMVLVVLAEHLKGSVPTPVAIAGIAAGSFALSSIISIIIRKVPVVGKLIVG